MQQTLFELQLKLLSGGKEGQLKMHWKFDNWIRHKKEFPEGEIIHIFSTEKDF